MKVPCLSVLWSHYRIFSLPKLEKKLPKTAALLKDKSLPVQAAISGQYVDVNLAIEQLLPSPIEPVPGNGWRHGGCG